MFKPPAVYIVKEQYGENLKYSSIFKYSAKQCVH